MIAIRRVNIKLCDPAYSVEALGGEWSDRDPARTAGAPAQAPLYDGRSYDEPPDHVDLAKEVAKASLANII